MPASQRKISGSAKKLAFLFAEVIVTFGFFFPLEENLGKHGKVLIFAISSRSVSEATIMNTGFVHRFVNAYRPVLILISFNYYNVCIHYADLCFFMPVIISNSCGREKKALA